MEDSISDWDSELELSSDSEAPEPPIQRNRRRSSCCNLMKSNQKLEMEIRLLREELTRLVSNKEKEQENIEEKESVIPCPPPLPTNLYDDIKVPLRNMGDVLKDITNVKLRKTQKNMRKKQAGTSLKSPDVRHDLYAILKRRYAAIHSPMQRSHISDMNDSWE